MDWLLLFQSTWYLLNTRIFNQDNIGVMEEETTSPLYIAFYHAYRQKIYVQQLLADPEVDINQTNDEGETPLYAAIY